MLPVSGPEVKVRAEALITETLSAYYVYCTDKSDSYTEIPGRRSIEDNHCMYIGPQGQRCAASRLAPNAKIWLEREKATVELNWKNIRSIVLLRLFDTEEVPALIVEQAKEFTEKIQSLHDGGVKNLRDTIAGTLIEAESLASFVAGYNNRPKEDSTNVI